LAKRKGENFSRIKPSTLAKLINTDTNPESIYNINSEFEALDVETKSNCTSTSKASQQTGTISLNTQQCSLIAVRFIT